ncbi:hypothetical protein [Rufibacter tibetensis]|uniref:Uncharacterized protein n=1 Tax=Rufibacter tibetensis TaxID=512763 RepID=A0A0N7HXC4_9BACT|nr:hypothetical protein [Rufibacter tibetensis]ALJ01657.1 hypothetical protein DC20_21595 [Rufibacter tibetensis]
MNQPNKFSIKKPRITLSEEQKNQARSGMAGEAVKASGEAAPKTPEPNEPAVTVMPAAGDPAPETETETLGAPDPDPSSMVEAAAPLPSRQGKGRGRKPEKNVAPVVEDSETQHVRMSKDAVMRAKMNVLLLPTSMGIRSLRDYGDAAFEFYEAHLRKTGKLPNR